MPSTWKFHLPVPRKRLPVASLSSIRANPSQGGDAKPWARFTAGCQVTEKIGILGPLLASRRARVLFGNYDFGTREDLMRMPEPILVTARTPVTFCGPTPLGTAVPVCQIEMQHD